MLSGTTCVFVCILYEWLIFAERFKTCSRTQLRCLTNPKSLLFYSFYTHIWRLCVEFSLFKKKHYNSQKVQRFKEEIFMNETIIVDPNFLISKNFSGVCNMGRNNYGDSFDLRKKLSTTIDQPIQTEQHQALYMLSPRMS